jgi:predicted O-methyltransferase YrrM
MYSPFRLGLKYLHYQITAANGRGHGMHSPFVYELITKVLNDQQEYPAYMQVENLRAALLKDESLVHVEDYGAGSVKDKSSNRKVSSIARNAAKPKKFGQLLFRLVKHYQISSVLELGTSLGLTTAYLTLATENGQVISIEGAPAIAELARKNLDQLQLKRVDLRVGKFEDILPGLLKEIKIPGLVFIDGNHRRKPTISYFQSLLNNCGPETILIFDDIHWSEEMEQAWAEISAHPSVRCTIDLFFIGMVFFREEFREKQHFTVRF